VLGGQLWYTIQHKTVPVIFHSHPVSHNAQRWQNCQHCCDWLVRWWQWTQAAKGGSHARHPSAPLFVSSDAMENISSQSPPWKIHTKLFWGITTKIYRLPCTFYAKSGSWRYFIMHNNNAMKWNMLGSKHIISIKTCGNLPKESTRNYLTKIGKKQIGRLSAAGAIPSCRQHSHN